MYMYRHRHTGKYYLITEQLYTQKWLKSLRWNSKFYKISLFGDEAFLQLQRKTLDFLQCTINKKLSLSLSRSSKKVFIKLFSQPAGLKAL